jgi:hypothetical protein
MKKQVITSCLVAFTTILFAQKAQIWLGPNFSYLPKSNISIDRAFITQIVHFNGIDTNYVRNKSIVSATEEWAYRSRIGLSGGIRWSKQLHKKMGLQYGLGLNYMSFNANKQTFENDAIEKVIVEKITKSDIDVPSLATSKVNLSTERLKPGIDNHLLELQIPLTLIQKDDDRTFGLGMQLNRKILVRTIEEKFIFERVEENTFDQTKKVFQKEYASNFTPYSFDSHFSYMQFYKRFGVEFLLSKRVTNFYKQNDVVRSTFIDTVVSQPTVKPFSASLRFIYQLK